MSIKVIGLCVDGGGVQARTTIFKKKQKRESGLVARGLDQAHCKGVTYKCTFVFPPPQSFRFVRFEFLAWISLEDKEKLVLLLIIESLLHSGLSKGRKNDNDF